MSEEPLRLHYYQRQLLGAADFTAEQTYHRTHRRRHNLGPHGYGVITGLQLVELEREGDAEYRDVIVMPGLAVDLFGREIVVLQPTRLAPSLFASFASDAKQAVWIAYDEIAILDSQGARMICEGTDLFSRVRETFKLFAGTQATELWDLAQAEVIVGGDPAAPPPPPAAPAGEPQLPPDGNVPYQEFEAPDTQRRWLVRLGSVRWDGTAGKFRPVADATHLTEERVWSGLYAASLRSESGLLRIGPRAPFADADAQDFATLEGRLTVHGRLTAKKDVEVHGHQARFLNTSGADESIPLWMQRRNPAADGIASELHIHIGDDDSAKTSRLSIGAGADATVRPAVAVRADRKMDVWNGKLRFSGPQRRQTIDLSLESDAADGAYGIGVQNSAAYTRTASDVFWYRGGVHDDAGGQPGAGGAVLLQLDAAGQFRFGAHTRQMLNLWNDEYGIGVQSSTLYFRSSFDFAWHRGGSHVDGGGQPGPGGTRLLLLDRQGRLFFGSETKQMLNLWGDNYGVGVQSSTLYFRSDNDFCWYRGGSHHDNRGDGGGGALAMKHDATNGLSVTGDVRASNNLYAHGLRVPIIDVKSGVHTLNETPLGSDTTRTGVFNLDVTTDIAVYSTANVMVALCDISNEHAATDARWRVEPDAAPIRLADNRARFPIRWQVDDTDGWLHKFSWIAIFTS